MINAKKTFLPPVAEYQEYLEKIWALGWITNFGPKATELESKLKTYFEVSHLRFVCNGTIAIQIAIQSLDLHREIITTPFSYVATTSSIAWENVFLSLSISELRI